MKGRGIFRRLQALALLVLLLLPSGAGSLEEKACSHQWELVSSTPATCTKAGKKRYRCVLCGSEKTKRQPALGHDWYLCTIVKEATCTENGLKRCICSRNRKHVQEEALPALGHRWSAWTTEQEATGNTDGTESRRCTRCGAVQQRSIPAPGSGWTVPGAEEVPGLWEKALAALEQLPGGESLRPVCCLAARNRGNGTDLCLLVREEEEKTGRTAGYALVYIFEDPENMPAPAQVVPLEIGLPGGQ